MLQHTALVLVDYQERLMPMIDQHQRVVANASRLSRAAQVLSIRTFGTEQNPTRLGSNVPALAQACETTLAKMHFDACEDGLLKLTQGLDPVVIAGCEAHVCLLQTALGLLRAGHEVAVVADACGSRSASDYALAMQRLRDVGATIVSTEMVLFEWVHTCEHPKFREVLALVKEVTSPPPAHSKPAPPPP